MPNKPPWVRIPPLPPIYKNMKTLRLTRKDLTFLSINNRIDEIKHFNFKKPFKEFCEADKVIFTDDDGKTKILKDRNAI